MEPSQDKTDLRHQALNPLLTTDCYYVQGELLDVAAALDAAALATDSELVRSQLAAVRACRQRLHDHVEAMEEPAGLYDYLEADAPAITPDLVGLCSEHCELDRRLAALEQRLASFNPADLHAVDGIRDAAKALAELTCNHRQHVNRIARGCAGSESPNPR